MFIKKCMRVSRNLLEDDGDFQVIPLWTDYNTNIFKRTNVKTVDSYMPSINEKDSQTCYNTQKRGSNLLNTVGNLIMYILLISNFMLSLKK